VGMKGDRCRYLRVEGTRRTSTALTLMGTTVKALRQWSDTQAEANAALQSIDSGVARYCSDETYGTPSGTKALR